MNIVEMRIKLGPRISESSGFFFVLSKDGLARVINEDDPELFKAWSAGWETEWDSARSVEKGLAWAYENKNLLPWDKFNPTRLTTPMVLYRSVSMPELNDIVKTGKIMGKGNSFNEFDHRSWVFFGDEITDELVHQGEDVERKAQIALDNHPIHAKFAELQDRLKEKREQIADHLRDDWKDYSQKRERAGWDPDPVNEKLLADYVADRTSLHGVSHLMSEETYKLTRQYSALRAKIEPLRKKYREHYRKQHAKIHAKQQTMAITSAILVTRPVDGGLVYRKGEGSESGFSKPEYGFPRGLVGLDDIEKVLYLKDGNVVAESLPKDIAKTMRDLSKVQKGTDVNESAGDVPDLAERIYAFLDRYAKIAGDYDPEMDEPEARFNGPDAAMLHTAALALEAGQKPPQVRSTWSSGCYKNFSADTEGRREHDEIVSAVNAL